MDRHEVSFTEDRKAGSHVWPWRPPPFKTAGGGGGGGELGRERDLWLPL